MPQLHYVRQDKEYTRIRRRGRFQIPAACAQSPKHFATAVEEAKKLLVQQLGQQGQRFVDVGWELQGPLMHIGHFLSDTPDPGPMATMPEITRLGNYDRAAMEAYERAEKARMAWDAGEPTDMEDYRVIGTFEVAIPQHYRAHVREFGR